MYKASSRSATAQQGMHFPSTTLRSPEVPRQVTGARARTRPPSTRRWFPNPSLTTWFCRQYVLCLILTHADRHSPCFSPSTFLTPYLAMSSARCSCSPAQRGECAAHTTQCVTRPLLRSQSYPPTTYRRCTRRTAPSLAGAVLRCLTGGSHKDGGVMVVILVALETSPEYHSVRLPA